MLLVNTRAKPQTTPDTAAAMRGSDANAALCEAVSAALKIMNEQMRREQKRSQRRR